MIITISGTPGSGKSTIAKLLAKKLGYRHYSAGDFMRAMAQERDTTLEALTAKALKDRSVDDEIDKRTVELGMEEDKFVIDSRLGWHFIPNAVKILLTVSGDEAARRIFAARRPDEQENVTLEKTKQNIAARFASERERYKRLYGVDYTDPKNHDLVIDTTRVTQEQIVDKILAFLKEHGIVKERRKL